MYTYFVSWRWPNQRDIITEQGQAATSEAAHAELRGVLDSLPEGARVLTSGVVPTPASNPEVANA